MTKDVQFIPHILWSRVLFWGSAHLLGVYACVAHLCYARAATYLWGILLMVLGTLGFTAGVHRLWAHRTYKAAWSVRALLLLLETLSPMCSAFEWARDHRVHHKFSDTPADPHDISRGFFFSHVGWLLVERHPLARSQVRATDVTDLLEDPLLMAQHRWFPVLWPTLALAYCGVACWGWDEGAITSLLVLGVLRTLLVLHVKWLVNSAAHTWGDRPYDTSMSAADSAGMSVLALGEGWHNFHHVFPWDYTTSELGVRGTSLTTTFIDVCARFGLASDRRTAPPQLVQHRARRTGVTTRLDH